MHEGNSLADDRTDLLTLGEHPHQYTWTFGISMALRVGAQGWSAWAVYVLVGTTQLALIAMGAWFKLAAETQPHEVRRKSLTALHFDGWDGAVAACDERSPLLASPMRRSRTSESESRPKRSSVSPASRGRGGLAVSPSPVVQQRAGC